jgi:hypothetical protein
MSHLNRAATADDILVSVHGRRLGIVGDGLSGDESALLLDGKVIGTNRPRIVVCQAGAAAAGAVALTGAVAGDTVENVTNITTPGDVTASFEATISVSGEIQQIAGANLSAQQLLFQVKPNS